MNFSLDCHLLWQTGQSSFTSLSSDGPFLSCGCWVCPHKGPESSRACAHTAWSCHSSSGGWLRPCGPASGPLTWPTRRTHHSTAPFHWTCTDHPYLLYPVLLWKNLYKSSDGSTLTGFFLLPEGLQSYLYKNLAWQEVSLQLILVTLIAAAMRIIVWFSCTLIYLFYCV